MSKTFGENLKGIRKINKLSQKALAEELEFSHNQISDWETGRSVPNIYQVCKIYKYLNVDIKELLKDID